MWYRGWGHRTCFQVMKRVIVEKLGVEIPEIENSRVGYSLRTGLKIVAEQTWKR